jgi:hypothetical protein
VLVRETKSLNGLTILQEVGKIDKDGTFCFVTLQHAEVELSSKMSSQKEAKLPVVDSSSAGKEKAKLSLNQPTSTVGQSVSVMPQGVNPSKIGKQKPKPDIDLAKRCLVRFGLPIEFLEKLTGEDQVVAKRLLEASQRDFLSLKLDKSLALIKANLETEWSSTNQDDRDQFSKRSVPGLNCQAVKPSWW